MLLSWKTLLPALRLNILGILKSYECTTRLSGEENFKNIYAHTYNTLQSSKSAILSLCLEWSHKLRCKKGKAFILSQVT